MNILDSFRLDDRVAIVTGGSRGIGFGIASAFASVGAQVVIAARDEAALESARHDIAGAGGTVLAVTADVTSQTGAAEVAEVAAAAIERFGGIDVLVNNVGGARGPGFTTSSLRRMSTEDFDNCFRFNLRSTILMAQETIEPMRARGGGSVVNIGSAIGRPYLSQIRGSSLYASAKAGLIQLTRYMALEWSPDVRVNCIASGLVESPASDERVQGELRANCLSHMASDRIGKPEDIAATALLLASDAGQWITGATYDVNGGMGLRSMI